MTPLDSFHALLASDPTVAPELKDAIEAARIKRLLDDDSDFWCAYDEDGTYGAEEIDS